MLKKIIMNVLIVTNIFASASESGGFGAAVPMALASARNDDHPLPPLFDLATGPKATSPRSALGSISPFLDKVDGAPTQSPLSKSDKPSQSPAARLLQPSPQAGASSAAKAVAMHQPPLSSAPSSDQQSADTVAAADLSKKRKRTDSSSFRAPFPGRALMLKAARSKG